MKKLQGGWNKWLPPLGFAGLLLLLFSFPKTGRTSQNPPSPQSTGNLDLSQKAKVMLMRKVLQERGIDEDYIDIIVAQSMHETNGFKSSLSKNNLNFFGMKQPIKRPVTVAVQPSKNEYLNYFSIEDSTNDFVNYSQYVGLYEMLKSPSLFTNPQQTINAYVTRLKQTHKYFEDSIDNYRNGVTRWYRVLQQG